MKNLIDHLHFLVFYCAMAIIMGTLSFFSRRVFFFRLFLALNLTIICSLPASIFSQTSPPNNSGFVTQSTATCAKKLYKRKEWKFRGKKFPVKIGFFSQKKCKQACKNSKRQGIEADHLVSLKDAHKSGGCAWLPAQKKQFANDTLNLVPACGCINAMKSAHSPATFIRLATDGKGVDFRFAKPQICSYIKTYAQVKRKYQLSFSDNDMNLFRSCGL